MTWSNPCSTAGSGVTVATPLTPEGRDPHRTHPQVTTRDIGAASPQVAPRQGPGRGRWGWLAWLPVPRSPGCWAPGWALEVTTSSEHHDGPCDPGWEAQVGTVRAPPARRLAC